MSLSLTFFSCSTTVQSLIMWVKVWYPAFGVQCTVCLIITVIIIITISPSLNCNLISITEHVAGLNLNVISLFTPTAAWLWGGPGRPQPRGVFHIQAERSFPRQIFPCSWGGLWQRWIRWGIQNCWRWFPLAREERAVPQEEEEETLDQGEETSLLTRGTNKLCLCITVCL